MLITPLDRKGLENPFNIFFASEENNLEVDQRDEIGLRTRSIMRTFNFMDPT